jgi:hypothetical protein
VAVPLPTERLMEPVAEPSAAIVAGVWSHEYENDGIWSALTGLAASKNIAEAAASVRPNHRIMFGNPFRAWVPTPGGWRIPQSRGGW